MAKTKYASSKILLTCASFLAFGSISALVSIRGPFGNSATAQTQPASVQRSALDDRGNIDGGIALDDSGSQQFDVSSSAPIARSRGS